jgi:hypothetical protein
MGVIITLRLELNHSCFFLQYKLKTKFIYAMGIIFFLWRFLRFITYGIKEKVTTLGLNRATLIA